MIYKLFMNRESRIYAIILFILVSVCCPLVTYSQTYSYYVGERGNLPSPTPPVGTLAGIGVGTCTKSDNVSVTGLQVYIHKYFSGTATVSVDYSYSYIDSYTKKRVVNTGTAYYNIQCLKTNLLLNYTEKEINVGESFELMYSTDPEGLDLNITWSTNDENIASLSNPENLGFKKQIEGIESVEVFGNKVGVCYITAEGNTGYTAPRCKVSVVDKGWITANVPSGTVEQGTAVTLSCSKSGASIYYTTDGTVPTKYSTKYSSPIIINTALTLKAKAFLGNDESSVLTRDYTVKGEATKVTVSPSSQTINVGESFTPTYTLTPSDATSTVTWNSEDSGIATVNQSTGKITGIKLGGTRVYARTPNDKYGSCFVKVLDNKSYPAIYDVKKISAEDHSLIVKKDGSLWTCGYGTYGQLGIGTLSHRFLPTKIMNDVAECSAGRYHSLMVKIDGSLWVCGYNNYGQLGDGTTEDRLVPVKIMDNVKSVSAGSYHSLILKTDGSLWACGDNYYGRLGDGTTINRRSPKKVMDGVASMSAGGTHSLILKTDGSLWACGYNSKGQLGDGTQTDRSTPVKVMDGVISMSAGGDHTLILKTDGSLWACGRNNYGQLGDGTTTSRSTPVKVMDGVVSMSAGIFHSLILKTDDSLWACGYNSYGQLGDGTITSRSTPVPVLYDNTSSIIKLTLSATPSGGEVEKGTVVKLSTPNISGADIYYTTNGSTPSKSSTKYTSSGITITQSCTLKAIAYKDGYETSDVGSWIYTIKQSDIEPTGISLPSSKTVKVGETFTMTYTLSPSNATTTLTWTSDDTSVASVSSSGVVKGIKVGTTYINVKTANGKTDYCKVTVEANNGDGTFANPFNAIGASQKASELVVGETSTQSYYVKGIVSSIKYYYSAQYGTATFYISDNGGTTTNQFYVYCAYYLENRPWVDGNPQIAIGDNLILYGKLANYEGTPEMANKENYIYSHNGKTAIGNGSYSIKLSNDGYATFYDSKLSYTLPSGLTAQVVNNVSNNKLTYKTTSNIPKGTAVMLKGNSSQTYVLTATENVPSYSGTNLLRGSDVATTTTGNGYHYKLSYGQSGSNLSNVFGWYWGAANGGSFQIEGHKAWLVVPNSSAARSFTIEGDATGIASVNSDEKETILYDLQGRRLNGSCGKGIYIKNGKKVIIK